MKLSSLKIEGFRRCNETTVSFGDATFLIGENNVGKSSVLRAIEILLSGENKLQEDEFCMAFDTETNTNIRKSDKIVLTGEFINVPKEAENWKGFKGRVLNDDSDINSTGFKIVYCKTFEVGKNAMVEMLSNKRKLKTSYEGCKNPKDFIEVGLDESIIEDVLGEVKLDKNLTKKQKEQIYLINEIWDVDTTEEVWDENPGGIVGNVLSKLPKCIIIPAQDSAEEIGEDGKKGAMIEIMKDLFEEVRDTSENFQQAQKYLNLLCSELDPSDEESQFGEMMSDLNYILNGVFPNTRLHASANLNDPNTALKPEFDIKLASNVLTKVSYQGTGMIRATVFSLLRYRENFIKKKGRSNRNLIIGFEEPEIYLHPNAANQMRDIIYELASENSQIICTTHSPYMIDLSRKPRQILNNFIINDNNDVNIYPFNISEKFKELSSHDKSYVKMLLKMDDYISRVFFAKKVIIVEGDTEEIVLKETINKIEDEIRRKILSEVQIIKARGKAVIISLVKYLKSMNINVFVIHDRDGGTEKAESFNRPIVDALGAEDSRIMLEECIEDLLGYKTSYEKPYKAFCHSSNWGKWDDIPKKWRDVVTSVFTDYFDNQIIS
ncbi:ATP-dependent nuclease [Dethiothermospora halolimnae]|uniref:ATP-dependent nuclease n=1 Tax=Dethiothermospora halolimnae TaxID=3114390 RepID=UPI003CCBA0F4